MRCTRLITNVFGLMEVKVIRGIRTAGFRSGGLEFMEVADVLVGLDFVFTSFAVLAEADLGTGASRSDSAFFLSSSCFNVINAFKAAISRKCLEKGNHEQWFFSSQNIG